MKTTKTPTTPARYYVHSILSSPVGRPVREPHWVMDRTTGLAIDQYSTKRAAKMHVRQLNDEAREAQRQARVVTSQNTVAISPDMFRLKTPCADCPFRQDAAGVRHGAHRAADYAGYFVRGDGATFPCHRSVPTHIDRETWTPWQEGQQICAGGLILAEKIGRRSRTVQACIDRGAHDPTTLKDADLVFDSVEAMLAAHHKT